MKRIDHLTRSGWENLKTARAKRGAAGRTRDFEKHLYSALGRASLVSGVATVREARQFPAHEARRLDGIPGCFQASIIRFLKGLDPRSLSMAGNSWLSRTLRYPWAKIG